MTAPIRTYQLAFYNPDGSLATILDLTGTMQLRYSNGINSYGAFQMTVPLSLLKPVMVTLDAVVQVIYYDDPAVPVIDGSYFLRRKDFAGQGMQDNVIIGGVGMAHILSRRLFLSEDDPLEANGFSTKSGPAAEVMAEIVNEQCINPAVNTSRAIPNLVLGTVPGTGNNVAFREESSDTRVIAFLQKLALASGTDFWIDYDPAGPVYTVNFGVVGTDRRKSTHAPLGQSYVYFSPQLGNINDPTLTIDRQEEGNHVYVFGQGPAGSRLAYDVSSAAVSDSPWNDCEFGVQAKNTKTVDDWITEADSALASQAREVTQFTFSPQEGTRGARYGLDYFVGDLVSGQFQLEEFEVRIAGVTVDINTGTEKVTPDMEAIV